MAQRVSKEEALRAGGAWEKKLKVLSYKGGEMETMAGQTRLPLGAIERTFRSAFG